MADNQLAKVLGALHLTTSFQTLYTASSTGDGKQFTGNIHVCPLIPSIKYDVQVYDGTNYFNIVEDLYSVRGGTDVIPVTVADGQLLQIRAKATGLTQKTISDITIANPAIITLDDTTGLNQSTDTLVYIDETSATTDVTDGYYRVTYVTATTVSLQDETGANFNNTTSGTDTGTLDIVPATVTLIGYEETIPQV